MASRKKTSENKKLGRNIARLRNNAGLTQEQLAEKTGISARYVQDLEAGIYTPTVFIAAALKRSLNCTWEDLLKGC